MEKATEEHRYFNVNVGYNSIDLPFGEPPPPLVFRLFLDRPSEIRLVMPEVLGITNLGTTRTLRSCRKGRGGGLIAQGAE